MSHLDVIPRGTEGALEELGSATSTLVVGSESNLIGLRRDRATESLESGPVRPAPLGITN
jgi:hypothetical protein